MLLVIVHRLLTLHVVVVLVTILVLVTSVVVLIELLVWSRVERLALVHGHGRHIVHWHTLVHRRSNRHAWSTWHE